MIWLKYAAIQGVQLLAAILGVFILLPFCWLEAWETDHDSNHYFLGVRLSFRVRSIKDARVIDQWRCILFNLVYGNPEDGVSGQQALVWTNGVLGPYMPNAPAWWRAYCWSAFRNSCDNLKYVFADPKGPLVTFQLFGRTCKVGWQMENGYNVPVLSL